jgi:hypothetical protein
MKPRLLQLALLLTLIQIVPVNASAYTHAPAFPGLDCCTAEQFLYQRYSMAYHARADRMLLLVHDILERFEEGTPSRLYFWQDDQWQPLPGVPPTAGGLSVMVYDSNRGVMVFWQGRGVASSPSGGGRRIRVGWTWEWDGANWRLAQEGATTWNLQPDGQWAKTSVWFPYGPDMEDMRHAPTPDTDPYYSVLLPTAAFDPRRGRVVMFGGLASRDRLAAGFAYEWDGAHWERRNPPLCRETANGAECDPVDPNPVQGPLSVQASAMGFHPPSGRLVMHGGIGLPYFYFFTNKTQFRGTSYSYDGERLYQHVQNVEPVYRRGGHAMVYDELTRRLVMFGGQSVNPDYDPVPAQGEDCWHLPVGRFDWWDGQRWNELPVSSPVMLATTRYLQAAAYDPRAHEIVAYGGLYNYRYERNPNFSWYDCLYNGWNDTRRIGFASAWVDYQTAVPPLLQTGGFESPYESLSAAFSRMSAEPFVIMKLTPGTGAEASPAGPFAITRPCLLEAPLGAVTLRKQ